MSDLKTNSPVRGEPGSVGPSASLPARIEALRRYGIPGADVVDPDLDALAAHAAEIAETPVALVTFVDVDRQWIAGDHGFGQRETPLAWSFCRHAFEHGKDGVWVVGDSFLEPLVRDTALVTGENPVRFYAGVVIETPDRLPLGAVCVIDHRPRTLDPRTERMLRLLAREVTTHLELRLARRSLRQLTPVTGVAPERPDRSIPLGWDPRHARFFYATPHPMWVFDVETLGFLAVNDAAVNRYGWSREEFLRMTLRDIRPDGEIADLELAVSNSVQEPHSFGLWRHKNRAGDELLVEISSQPIEFDGRTARLTIAVDVTARVEAVERLKTSEASLELAQRIGHVGSWELDLRSGRLAWSDETFRLFGHRPQALQPTYDLFLAAVHPEDRARMAEAQRAALAGECSLDIEHRIVRARDGVVRWVHEVGSLKYDEQGLAVALTGTVFDITDRHTANARLARINRLYRVLSETNEAIVRTSRFEELVQEVLRIAVEEGAFAMGALVGLGDDGEVIPWVVAGDEGGYFAERSSVDAAELGGVSPVVLALQTGEHHVCNDLANEYHPLAREAALRRGYRAKGVFCLRGEGANARALVFFARETGYFQEEERELLGAVANDLSYAADVYRRDALRAQVEGELATTRKQKQLILESVGEGIHGIDREGRILFENRAALAMFGHDGGEFFGRLAHELVHHHKADGSPYPREDCPIHRTLRDGVTRRVDDEVFFRADGSSFPVEYVCAPITDDAGHINGAVVSFRDISERLRRERFEAFEVEVRQASEQPIADIAVLVAQGLESILGVRASVGGFDERGKRLVQMAAPSMGPGFDRVAGELLATADLKHLTELGRAGRPVVFPHIEDMRVEVRAAARVFDFASLVSVPVMSEAGVLLATVTLLFRESRAPRPDELEIVSRVAYAFAAVCEKKRADAALAEAMSLLAMAGRVAKVGGWSVDLDEQTITWSDEVCDMHEVPHGTRPTVEEAQSFYMKAHFERLQDHFARCFQQAIPFDTAVDIRTARGAIRTLRIIAEPVSEQGRIVSVRGAFQDVTEHYATHELLREQADLLDRAQDAILVRDLDHQILSWNKGAERIYGWTRGEAVGRSIKGLLYSDTTRFTQATQECIERGEWSGEIEQLTREGRRVTVMGRWSLVRDTDGAPRTILAINTDITDKKRLEQNLFRAQRLESIGTLAGGIAHDLNNVLAPILMAVSALADEEEDAEKREDLATIQRCAERGAHMVRQLLLFARGNDGRMSRLRISDIVTEVYRMMRDTFPKNIGIRQDLADGLWDVQADPTQVHQMLTNLCVNARDAMPMGGLLTIALENTVIDEIYAEMHVDARPGAYVLMRVEDTGAGMTREVLERIFEPFFTTKEVGKGTGLGLSTVHAIVRGHRGFINVYSEVGKGTRIRVYLPADPPTESRAMVSAEQTRLPRGNGELVLLVDDEEAIRTIASRTLERHGYRVMMASNGAEAVAIYARYPREVAVVLTDMAMPVMDGPATIIALRAMNPAVRIVGSSGLNANGNVVKAMDAGVKHFVPKPYTTEALLRVLRRILVEDEV